MLKATLEAHPDVVVFAFLDDIWLIGPPELIRAAYGTLRQGMLAIELDLNVMESKLFSPSGECPEFSDAVVDGNGIPISGAALVLEGTKRKFLQLMRGGRPALLQSDALYVDERGPSQLVAYSGKPLPLNEESGAISQAFTWPGGLGSLIHPTTVIGGVDRFLGSGVASDAAWSARAPRRSAASPIFAITG
ncbi:hypothetical protein CYMTET_7605 [Cymbomonas tetramitiformis]|uniref:Uncharacterized protein n=1 Tax=Cymbomonas tetramitiformis TaxID=36881 RepID=A0AAE0GUU0_9CHLO|nr:hypothetical protein CYMTET_7605 [Cymbomonas tetramitiformis]